MVSVKDIVNLKQTVAKFGWKLYILREGLVPTLEKIFRFFQPSHRKFDDLLRNLILLISDSVSPIRFLLQKGLTYLVTLLSNIEYWQQIDHEIEIVSPLIPNLEHYLYIYKQAQVSVMTWLQIILDCKTINITKESPCNDTLKLGMIHGLKAIKKYFGDLQILEKVAMLSKTTFQFCMFFSKSASDLYIYLFVC